MKRKWMFLAPVAIGLFVTLGGQVVSHLWNWLMPGIFGWHEITFWQALGLLALCRILFGGGGPGFRGRGQNSEIRRKLSERFGKMTPEQREHFCRPRTPGTAESV